MPRKQENLERNYGFLIADVGRLLKTDYDRRLSHTGLTRSQWWVLNQLYRRDGVTQAELADIMEMERPALGRLLDRLESSGWVRREEDAEDRRAKRVYLTEAVTPVINEMRDLAAETRRDASRGLSNDDLKQLVDMLLVIKQNVTEQLDSDHLDDADAPLEKRA